MNPSSQRSFRAKPGVLEVLQAGKWVVIDRKQIAEVHFQRPATTTVRYTDKQKGEIDCRQFDASELKLLIATMQSDRDRNLKRRRAADRGGAAVLIPIIFGLKRSPTSGRCEWPWL
jgi:hypothetical protein